MIALKTSTLANNSKAVMISTSENSNYVVYSAEEAFDCLIKLQENTDFLICWNINEFMSLILRMMAHEALKALFEVGKIGYHGYTLYYNQGKSFGVGREGIFGTYAAVYWIEQYFDGPEPSLDIIASEGMVLLKDLNSIGIRPKKLTSAIAMLEERINNTPLPTWRDVPDNVNNFAALSSGQAWTEAHKLGYFVKTYDYDIVSSFPSIMANLYDTRYGKWIESREIPASAVYGYAAGEVTVSSEISPILYQMADDKWYSPKGKWPTVLGINKVKWLYESGKGKIDIDTGVWWILAKDVKPLIVLMHSLFGKRQETELLNRIVKRAMNGIYGRFLQKFRDNVAGKNYMPVWGEHTESGISVKVDRFIQENNASDSLIHVSTDGVLLSDRIELAETGKMGSWRLDSINPALIVNSGIVFYGDKRPNQITFREAIQMIQTDPDNFQWEKKYARRMTLGDHIEHNRVIGEIGIASTGFNLIGEHDRYFKKLPKTGKDLLENTFDSKALEIRRLKHV